jgi:hypothetical protein
MSGVAADGLRLVFWHAIPVDQRHQRVYVMTLGGYDVASIAAEMALDEATVQGSSMRPLPKRLDAPVGRRHPRTTHPRQNTPGRFPAHSRRGMEWGCRS